MNVRGTFSIHGGPAAGQTRPIDTIAHRDHTWSDRFSGEAPWAYPEGVQASLHYWLVLHFPERNFNVTGFFDPYIKGGVNSNINLSLAGSPVRYSQVVAAANNPLLLFNKPAGKIDGFLDAGIRIGVQLPWPIGFVGADFSVQLADKVLLDLDSEWTVGEHGFRSRSGNSWLLGSRLMGAVRMTLAGGQVAFE